MSDNEDKSIVIAEKKSKQIRKPWKQVRRFLVFQIKLYVDAFRDFVLSFLSIPAFVIDLLTGHEGKDSYMEKVLALGRRTEKSINLFEQHSHEEQDGTNVDSIINHLEKKVRGEADNFKNNNQNN